MIGFGKTQSGLATVKADVFSTCIIVITFIDLNLWSATMNVVFFAVKLDYIAAEVFIQN